MSICAGSEARSEAKSRGAEPDECYTIGPMANDGPPDLAIEVVVSNPLLDKLDVYAALGVLEVWVWHSPSRDFVLHRLRAGAYHLVTASELLVGLDLELLASFVRAGENHTAPVKSFRQALRR
jgi:Uma2 family endonuclease